MHVELINTGSELLLGQVVNTHLKYLAEALWGEGLTIQRQVTVPDGDPIREALIESFSRADVVIVTGGLGPTTDDITRDVTAQLLGLKLSVDPDIAKSIEDRLKTRNIRMTPRVLRQAERPGEAEVLNNKNGTAPGLYFAPLPLPSGRKSPHLFLLPGPPKELKPMVESELLPRVRALMPAGAASKMQTWRVVGVPESIVEEAVGPGLIALGIEPGYCARPGEVDVRVMGSSEQIDAASRLLQECFGSAVLPKDSSTLEDWLVAELARRGKTLATAESCSGGALANQITNVSGSSSVFGYGFVTYANAAKELLGVPRHLLETHGAVSQPVAEALALHALQAANADYALATTGIAGPTGGSDEKPLGTVYIALAKRSAGVTVEKHRFASDRLTFKHLVVQHAMTLLRRELLSSS
jgi:nicotinamide-nucleotide amidase